MFEKIQRFRFLILILTLTVINTVRDEPTEIWNLWRLPI